MSLFYNSINYLNTSHIKIETPNTIHLFSYSSDPIISERSPDS